LTLDLHSVSVVVALVQGNLELESQEYTNDVFPALRLPVVMQFIVLDVLCSLWCRDLFDTSEQGG
jgi:hypothetical protein